MIVLCPSHRCGINHDDYDDNDESAQLRPTLHIGYPPFNPKRNNLTQVVKRMFYGDDDELYR